MEAIILRYLTTGQLSVSENQTLRQTQKSSRTNVQLQT
jgi:hypothetical protein